MLVQIKQNQEVVFLNVQLLSIRWLRFSLIHWTLNVNGAICSKPVVNGFIKAMLFRYGFLSTKLSIRIFMCALTEKSLFHCNVSYLLIARLNVRISFSTNGSYWGCCWWSGLPPLWHINGYTARQSALGSMVSRRSGHSNIQVRFIHNKSRKFLFIFIWIMMQ